MNMVALPVLIPLVSAVVCLLVRRRPRVQRAVAVMGAAALLVAGVALVLAVHEHGRVSVRMGGWPAPFAITLAADMLSALMVAITGLIALTGTVYSLAEEGSRECSERQRAGHFVLLHVLFMGVSGAFLTADLFNLFVWFEVMLMASFVLLVLGGGRDQVRGAMTYVSINLISSVLFLVAVGLIYAVCHTLNMADAALRLDALAASHPHLVGAMAALLAVSFGIKAGVFPLFSWLPASYHTPPAAVSAIFAGLLTKVGVYALLRVFITVFPPLPALYTILMVISGLTMIIGVLGAVSKHDMKKILSFHIISQIGYIIIGLGLLSSADDTVRALGVTATIFYMLHHIVVKTNLFFIAGIIERMYGSGRLDRLGGLMTTAPWLAALLAIPALSLAGVPPLSGFWAKLVTFQAAAGAGAYAIIAAAAVAGLLTLISMVKIWNAAVWTPLAEPRSRESWPRPPLTMVAPVVALALITVSIGVAPQWLFELAQRAASDLLAVEPHLADALVLDSH